MLPEMDVTGIGAFGVFTILLLRELKPFVSRASKSSSTASKCVLQTDEKKNWEGLRVQMQWLVDIHNHRDADGVPVWYVKRSLEQAVLQCAEAQGKLAEALMRIADVMDKIDGKLDEVGQHIGDIK